MSKEGIAYVRPAPRQEGYEKRLLKKVASSNDSQAFDIDEELKIIKSYC